MKPFGATIVVLAALTACGKVTQATDAAGSSTDGPSSAVAIAFGTAPPASAQAEAAIPAFTVEVRDASGAVVAGDNQTAITIAASSGAYSGARSFAGTTTRSVVAGVATFDDLVWPFPEVVTFTVSAGALPSLADQHITITAVPVTKIVVADQEANTVSVFDLTASGNVAPLRAITGASTTFNFSWGVGYDQVADQIVVANFGGNALDRFPLTADGNVAPTSALIGATTLLDGPSRPSFDYIHDEVYVGMEDGDSVAVYSRTATGDTAPLRNLAGASTTFMAMDSAAVDYATDELYTTGFGAPSVMVFPRTATGDVAPTRTITGAATLLTGPFQLVVVPEHDELIVGDESSGILTFALDASGNVAPIRQITGATSLAGNVEGLAYDPVTDLLFVAGENSGVLVFHRTDNGDVAPLRQLVGATTGITSADDVALAR